MSEDQPPSPKFADFPFCDTLRKDIAAAGFETPMPVQAECIPFVLDGKDVIGLAQTGTGKTAAFALPIIHRLAGTVEMRALVLAPTRELAQQIAGVFEELGESSHVRPAVVVGGIPIDNDYHALRHWPNVLVATPGRLIDHIRSGTVILDDIEVFVIDEADRMHDMGFIPQVNEIIRALPEQRQTLLFSATMPDDVEQIARRHMKDPELVAVGRRGAPAERARQVLLHVRPDEKTDRLRELLAEFDGRTLVFVRTKRGVDRLARSLRGDNRVTRIHGDLSQPERDRAMNGFRDGKYRVLIATDIAARGIDVTDIEHVINYDFPHTPEDYVHRIGRTARVEASGRATSFVTRDDRRHVAAVEKLIGRKMAASGQPEGGDGDSGPKRSSPRKRRGRRGRSRGRRRSKPAAKSK
jgi:ATP-dependent RNA helicase RhlE